MSAEPRVARLGARALLVDLDGLAAVRRLDALLVADPPDGVLDVVPAARTVLVTVDRPGRLDALRPRVEALARRAAAGAGEVAAPVGPVVEIPVVYDGEDLADVAAWAGLDVDDVVARHARREYVVGFGGFMPGFAYLQGVDPAIAAPRLPSPRPRVPAGAVALAGGSTAVYPRATPGGWRLLGRTDVVLFDPDRDPPALLRPGARVRFVPVATSAPRTREAAPAPAPETGGWSPAADDGEPALEVLAPGPLTTVQDLGRPGWARAGVGSSGAADRGSARLANRLVGNPEGAAVLEVTLGGLAARALRPLTVALTGATVPATVDGTPVGGCAPLELRPGAVLRLGTATSGLRAYVGVRGGADVPPVLGSRSTDGLAGLGPAPLVAGVRLAVGPAPADPPPVDVAPVRPRSSPPTLRLDLGPRADWFLPGPTGRGLDATFVVGQDSDRVALRLDGPPVAREDRGELPSEGLVRGAVQVPPDGRPVLFLADHPVTGGYPVLGVVREEDVDVAAQLRPGDRVRLRVTGS